MNQSSRHFLDRAFPVPKSLSLSNTSVSISDGFLTYFELTRSQSGSHPKSWDMVPFPSVRPGKGDDEQSAEAVSALAAFSKKHGLRCVHGLIHEGEAYAFRVTLPTVNIAQLRPAIESILEENVPVPPAECVFEYSVINEDLVRGETSVAVSVVSEKVVQSYSDLFLASGLAPVAFETEARALSAALFPPDSNDVVVVLAIKPRHSLIFITERGAVVFSSVVDIGTHDINQAISKSLGVSVEEAQTMKKEGGLGDGADTKIFNASLPVLSSLHDELGRVLVFWKAQEKKIKDFKEVSRIVLSGSDSLMSGLGRYISLSFKLPTEIGSVWTNVLAPESSLPSLPLRESLDYGASIGAIIK